MSVWNSAMTGFLERLMLYPYPLRVALFKRSKRLFQRNIPYSQQIEDDDVPRPYYAYCIYKATLLAKSLGYPKISIIELGVAGGNGLVNIEEHVSELTKEFGIEYEVYGFDSGQGLPDSDDCRDLQYVWKSGFYQMDLQKLQNRLRLSRLVIGDLRETSPTFISKFKPAPIGCVLIDLDYYTSTKHAFKLFDGPSEYYLPRIYCYCDDIHGVGLRAANEYTGELRAINEFNEENTTRKIAKEIGLSWLRNHPARWNEQIFIYHDFSHPRYNEFVFYENQQSPLEERRGIR